MRHHALLSEIARRLRDARLAAGLSVAEAATRAGVSPRYLRMAEAGEANLSLLKLAGLARALRLPLGQLCDLELSTPPPQRVALLGVRGAGKSSVGRLLSQRIEVPFVELDQLVEERAGMTLEQVFGVHGEDWYRELQAEALEAWLAQHGRGVLATGGSIVNDEVCYQRLRATCRTVWLRATPEQHWQRVLAQGDLRPMEGRPRAMVQLENLLAERAPRYALADLELDTSERPAQQVAATIAEWLAA